jgi:hypothetical protein
MRVHIGALAIVAALRVFACLFPPKRSNPGPTFLMAIAGLILCIDLSRGLVPTPEPVVRLAPPFEGSWIVLQGGQSPMQSHHLSAYNQHWALDLLPLDRGGRLFVDGEEGNSRVLAWEHPLFAPVAGRIAFTRDTMDDSEGPNFVSERDDAVGNSIVIETADGHFVLFAHLRRGTIEVEEGQSVSVGDPLALVGNSGNTTLPHLHLQVQTHVDLWDPANRSVPFAFGTRGRVPSRNDRISGLAQGGAGVRPR